MPNFSNAIVSVATPEVIKANTVDPEIKVYRDWLLTLPVNAIASLPLDAGDSPKVVKRRLTMAAKSIMDVECPDVATFLSPMVIRYLPIEKEGMIRFTTVPSCEPVKARKQMDEATKNAAVTKRNATRAANKAAQASANVNA